MKDLFIIFSVLLSTSLFGQIGPDGTGIVNGYFIGPNSYLRNANLTGADLRNANLAGAYLLYANLTDADLRGANLDTGRLYDANFSGADFTDASLSGANLSGTNLSRANLSGANLSGAELSGADLSRAELSGADIRNTNLSGADLSFAGLSNADLRETNFSDADLSGADFSGADLSNLSSNALDRTIWSNAISQSDYDPVVAERDAALAAQASAEAERDALPTQEAYDAVATKLTTLEERVLALLPKERSSNLYELVLLNAGTLGSNQDYTTVSDSGDGPREFDFEAQQGQLRWYSNGVELLNNSKIRISSADGQAFNLDSITFDQWVTEGGFFSETIQASSEQEARAKAVQEYYNANEVSGLTVSDNEGNLVYSFSTEFGPNDFEVSALTNAESLLDAGTLGSNQDYTSVSDSGDGTRSFDFNALQGKLRWYSNGVELLNNSKIRISSGDGQPFNLDSITFGQWETEGGIFSEIIQASSEQEARVIAVEMFRQNAQGGLLIQNQDGETLYQVTPSVPNSGDFDVRVFSPGEYLVDYFVDSNLPEYRSVTIPSGDELDFVDITVEGFKIHVDSFNVSTSTNRYTATLETPQGQTATSAQNVSYVDIETKGFKVHVDGFNVSYTVLGPLLATHTLEEYVDELIEGRSSAIAAQAAAESERDARPTQASYDAVVAERDARLTMDEVRDARIGSTMIEVSQGRAEITMTLEESADISDWSNPTTSEKTFEVDASGSARFYRFKVAE